MGLLVSVEDMIWLHPTELIAVVLVGDEGDLLASEELPDGGVVIPVSID